MLDNLTGESPANYFARFKWVVDAAKRDGYFRDSPTEDIPAIANPSVALKEILEPEEYLALLRTPFQNQQVKLAFLFSCYTGLRWIDVQALKWKDIEDGVLTTRIIQKKTGRPVLITLHPIAKDLLDQARKLVPFEIKLTRSVFTLPTSTGANKSLKEWMKAAFSDIQKESILLYDAGNVPLTQNRELAGEEKRKIAQEDFDIWFQSAKAFLKGANFYLNEGELKIAAFELI